MQIVVLLDATDAMTSQTIEARHAYQAADIVLVGDDSAALIRRLPDGCLTVDYSCFQAAARGAKTVERAVAEIPRPAALSGCSFGSASRAPSTPLADFASPDRKGGWAESGRVDEALDEEPSAGARQDAFERLGSGGMSGLSLDVPGSEDEVPRYRRTTGGGALASNHKHATVIVQVGVHATRGQQKTA